MSHVTGQVSGVRCQVSGVTFFLDNSVKVVGGGSVINGAYPLAFKCSVRYPSSDIAIPTCL